jgi:hypothetical protein
MTPEEFYRQLRDEYWSPVLANVKKGKHPPLDEMAGAIFELGVEAKSPAAEYVAKFIVGEIKRGRGNDGSQRSVRPSDSSLRVLYKFELAELQDLRARDPKKYASDYGKSAPSVIALKHVANEFAIGPETVRKAVHKRGV